MNDLIKIYIPSFKECVLSAEKDEFEQRLVNAIERSNHCELTRDVEKSNLVIINQIWAFRNWHHIEQLESCTFLSRYSQKIVTISHDDVSTTFFPGLYASLTSGNRLRNWAEPCGYKKQYRSTIETASTAGVSEKPHRLLFSFRGAEFSHPIRKKLAHLYSEKSGDFSFVVVNKKFHSHSGTEHLNYIEDLLGSHFILAPGGFSPSTYRMFEAMQYGRCPVIISDEWQPIAGVDWEKCSIRVAEKDIGNLIAVLTERVSEAEDLGREARRVWQENFSDNVREKRMLHELIKLHETCSRNRDFYNLQRFWNSRKFFHAHGWTFTQRLARKLRLNLARN